MEKTKRISSENILMIVLGFMAFSSGIWSNYRQLWLEEAGFSITDISRILSVALVCSSVIAFFISFFSSKVKVKNIILLSFVFRSVAMCALLFVKDTYIIKTAILLGIMCEVIFSIAFYPLLSFVTKTDESFRKKTLIEYFSRDIGVVLCGLLLGVSIGRFIFNYNTCLILSIISSLASCAFLIMYKEKENNHHKPVTLFNSMKEIFTSKINNIYLINQLIINISYGIVFDLMMLILTNYLGFEVAFTSVFIIVCNMFGTVASSIFSKIGTNYSIRKSAIIKFGIRSLGYLVAFLVNTNIVFVISIVIAYITSRILEDKVTGAFLQIVDENNQFLYGNIRYFVACLGEGIGAFLAGVLIVKSFRLLFLGAAIVTIIQTIILVYLSKLRSKMS